MLHQGTKCLADSIWNPISARHFIFGQFLCQGAEFGWLEIWRSGYHVPHKVPSHLKWTATGSHKGDLHFHTMPSWVRTHTYRQTHNTSQHITTHFCTCTSIHTNQYCDAVPLHTGLLIAESTGSLVERPVLQKKDDVWISGGPSLNLMGNFAKETSKHVERLIQMMKTSQSAADSAEFA